MQYRCRGVNQAFPFFVRLFNGEGGMKPSRKPSRVGEVLALEEPVLVTYEKPKERVLVNPERDANPFFHLYESLWMLAGRQDIAPLAYYSSGYPKQVQDGDNPNANGAYGYRWRESTTVRKVMEVYCDERDGGGIVGPGNQVVRASIRLIDQLEVLAKHLSRNPTSRRAVLQMWNVGDDLDNLETSKDVCCNTHAYFALRSETSGPSDVPPMERTMPVTSRTFLDMTVCNRSNDLIWGMLGANVVHFSFLQEYMAAKIGVEVGVYNQFTNNLHVYTERFEPDKWMSWGPVVMGYFGKTVPLVRNVELFDKELPWIVKEYEGGSTDCVTFQEPFFNNVAVPLLQAYRAYKIGGASAMSWAQRCEDEAWRTVATQWLEKRYVKKAKNQILAKHYGGKDDGAP